MSTTYQVRLPAGRSPRFPRECVVCGAPTAEAIAVGTGRIALDRKRSKEHFLPHAAAKSWPAPACAECLRRERSRESFRTIVFFSAVGIGSALGRGHEIEAFGIRLPGWFVLMPLLLIAFGWLAARTWPREFEVDARASHVDFRFARADCARDFAELNSAEVLSQTT